MARTFAVPKVPPDVGTRALLRLAGPTFVAQLAVMGLAVIDTLMAGRLSANDLAAIAVGSSLYTSVYIAFMGMVQALTPIAGHHFGAGRSDEIGVDLVQALWLAAALGAIGFVLLLWHDAWLDLLDAPASVRRIASVYLDAIAFALPASLGTRVFASFNSALSRPKVTMAIQLVAIAAKVPLNLLFMYGAGPIPALGGAGCGVASATLAYGTFTLSALVFRFDPAYVPYRTGLSARIRPDRLRELLKLGLPMGGSLLIEVTSFTFMALFIVRFGAEIVAGHQIMTNLVSVLFMLPMSIGAAAGVLTAQSLGAQAPLAAERAARRGFMLAAALALGCAVLIWLLREPLIGAYTRDAAVADVALGLIGLICLFHVFDAFQGVAGFVLRGYKVAATPMLIHGVTLWGVGLGGGYVLAFVKPFGWTGGGALSFWVAALAGIALTAIALTALSFYVARRRAREAAQG